MAWDGPRIVDARCVRAGFGYLIALTADGGLHGIDFDAGSSVPLCRVELPRFEPGGRGVAFGDRRHRLHASSDGSHVAIVVDQGQHGLVVDTRTGSVVKLLDGGDYHEDTVPFSACFATHEGRDVLVHRTDWNRLDVMDPATGASLTQRHIARYETGGDRPEHYLDYFHGRLLPSPDGSQLFDDGWVWHPVSQPCVWSVTNWLNGHPWESEDGPSLVYLGLRDDWTTPATWIDERHLALWGPDLWEDDEAAGSSGCPKLRLLDVTQREPSPAGRWPMPSVAGPVRDLFSDGQRLYVATESGTTVFDLATRAQIEELAGFTACLHDRGRRTLVDVGDGAIRELAFG